MHPVHYCTEFVHPMHLYSIYHGQWVHFIKEENPGTAETKSTYTLWAHQRSLSWALVPAEINMDVTEDGNLLEEFYHVCWLMVRPSITSISKCCSYSPLKMVCLVYLSREKFKPWIIGHVWCMTCRPSPHGQNLISYKSCIHRSWKFPGTCPTLDPS
jgi:hypothetical protein